MIYIGQTDTHLMSFSFSLSFTLLTTLLFRAVNLLSINVCIGLYDFVWKWMNKLKSHIQESRSAF